jgi:hypothetical protein
MQPSVVLVIYLATLYILSMVIFWHSLRGQKTTATQMTELIAEVPFALQEGQTILGVMDTTKITCFCIGQIGEHVHDEEETIQ